MKVVTNVIWDKFFKPYHKALTKKYNFKTIKEGIFDITKYFIDDDSRILDTIAEHDIGFKSLIDHIESNKKSKVILKK